MDDQGPIGDNIFGNGKQASHATSRPGPVYSMRLKLLVLVVLVAVAGAFTLAYQRTTGDDGSITRSGGTAEFVDELLPAQGSRVLQQATVSIRLTPGWNATLDEIAGRSIPPDQLRVRSDINTVEFTPGPDKAWDALPAGRVCADASVWEIARGREAGTRSVTWCFDVL
jgi:uncharacterized protein (UPF0333 family)